MAAKRKRFNDDFRASAVLMLEATGYPEKKGGLTQVSTHLGVPLSTLRGWFTAERNPPPGTEPAPYPAPEYLPLVAGEAYPAP